MALLSQDLGFEFEHIEKKMEETHKMKMRLQEIQGSKNDEEYMEKFVIRPGEENAYKKIDTKVTNSFFCFLLLEPFFN